MAGGKAWPAGFYIAKAGQVSALASSMSAQTG